MGLANGPANVLQGISAVGSATAVLLAWRSRASMDLKCAVLLTSSFLFTPYAWDYDAPVMLLAVVWVWEDARWTGWRPGEAPVMATLWLSLGFLALEAPYPLRLNPAPACLWAGLLFMIWRCVRSPGCDLRLLPDRQLPF
jgi:hypothetical protein